ncbi:MAG: alkaline phosphatase family protein [Methylobacter sp.]|nr:alkaline phosphatase family protein [Methylobacter sp.]
MKKLKKLTALGVSVTLLSPYCAVAGQSHSHAETETPIEHLIVIVGENHTFDNIYGAYQPKNRQKVSNLLAKHIINKDGTPGPAFFLSAQQKALDYSNDGYSISPVKTGPYLSLPQPQTTYATGLPPGVADDRYPSDLPNGPFQLTNESAPVTSYFGDPMHRFFQMWQQTDKGKNDLFVWVGLTAGIGSQNNFPGAPVPGHTFQGGEAMGFYNMNTGDAQVFKDLADNYAMSDNYHQFIMGGTGANFIALVTGDAGFYTQNGQAAVPPETQIENPNAIPDYNNYYTQDGYSGGSYVNCSDRNEPGVESIRSYLDTRKAFHDGNCAPEHYYLVNNYGLAYDAKGNLKPFDSAEQPPKTILPPQHIPTIADALSAKGISWKYYSGGRNPDNSTTNEYCSICDPLTGFTSIMTTDLIKNLQGMDAFNSDVLSENTLPAVSFIRPFESQAGHPANATLPDFEQFVMDVVNKVKANPKLWQKTAILITMDEGGGYYDSGYIQPIDFFGDGTRIPLVVVSPWAKKGHIDHDYSDHASILKFIEKNWRLDPLSDRSRDNLPNPVHGWFFNVYAPRNTPAISDLTHLFNFKKSIKERQLRNRS